MEFINPPSQKKGPRSDKWINIVKTLKENKGTWALVGDYSPGVATYIRRGAYKAFLDPDDTTTEPEMYMRQHWEITTRKTNNGTRNDVYIRWLG